ncbi:MAG: LytR C-terminal domain-containing protein [Kineosporiaceae bacterium]
MSIPLPTPAEEPPADAATEAPDDAATVSVPLPTPAEEPTSTAPAEEPAGDTPADTPVAEPDDTAATEHPPADLPEVAAPWGPGTEPGQVEVGARVSPAESPPIRQLRHRRQTGVFLRGLFATLLVGVAAYTNWVGVWSLPFSMRHANPEICATLTPTAAPVKNTAVRVYNASTRSGLATAITKELQNRGFRVPDVGNDPEGGTVTGPAEVRYGPNGVLAARTVAATVNGEVALVDDGRSESVVDLVVGQKYAGLRSAADVDEIIAPPAQACSAAG